MQFKRHKTKQHTRNLAKSVVNLVDAVSKPLPPFETCALFAVRAMENVHTQAAHTVLLLPEQVCFSVQQLHQSPCRCMTLLLMLFSVFNVQPRIAHRDTDDSKQSIFLVFMCTDILPNEIKPPQALCSYAPDEYVSKNDISFPKYISPSAVALTHNSLSHRLLLTDTIVFSPSCSQELIDFRTNSSSLCRKHS